MAGTYMYVSAQPTWDFETWSGAGASTEPSGWISENELTVVGNPQSAFKETTAANVHGGAASMKLVCVTMTNPIAGLPNPIGLAAPGKLTGFKPKFGMPYTGRPASVDFWYKYTPVSGDFTEFLVILWNSTTQDTLGSGYWTTGTAANNYTSQVVTITYNPAYSAELPDSMALTFSSSKLFNPDYSFCSNCGKAGSTLWVDDVTFSGWNGINEHPASNNIVAFPNPANDHITIIADVAEATTAVAYDATGRMISSVALNQVLTGITRKEGTISTSNLSSGLYVYSITDKNGNSLRTAKFNVVR